MHPVQFEIALEFTLNGRRYRTDKVTARLVEEPESQPFSRSPEKTTPTAAHATLRHSDSTRLATFQLSTLNSQLSTGPYALRKGLGVWTLTFNGQQATIKHERGIFYVAWLLAHPPPTPIHALDLISKIPEIYRHQLGLAEIFRDATRIQERSLSVDDAQALRALLKKQKELEAILDDESESEPVKQEALRELEAIAEFQKRYGRRTQTNAQRAADAVRKAITRFHDHLAEAKDAEGNPHPVLVPFAEHVEKYILIPSRRYAGPGNRYARSGLFGRFTYEPPPDVIWRA